MASDGGAAPPATTPAPQSTLMDINLQLDSNTQLAGTIISLAAFGVTSILLVVYLHRFRDASFLRTIVIVVFLTHLANLIINTGSTVSGLVDSVRNAATFFQDPTRVTKVSLVLLLVEEAFVQLILNFRVWRVSRSWLLTLLSTICVTAQIASGIAFVVIYVFERKVFPQQNLATINLWFRFVLIADVILALILSVHLLKRASGTKGIKAFFYKVILLIVSSGTSTAILSIIVLVAGSVKNARLFYISSACYWASLPIVLLANLMSGIGNKSWDEKGLLNPDADARMHQRGARSVDIDSGFKPAVPKRSYAATWAPPKVDENPQPMKEHRESPSQVVFLPADNDSSSSPSHSPRRSENPWNVSMAATRPGIRWPPQAHLSQEGKSKNKSKKEKGGENENDDDESPSSSRSSSMSIFLERTKSYMDE